MAVNNIYVTCTRLPDAFLLSKHNLLRGDASICNKKIFMLITTFELLIHLTRLNTIIIDIEMCRGETNFVQHVQFYNYCNFKMYRFENLKQKRSFTMFNYTVWNSNIKLNCSLKDQQFVVSNTFMTFVTMKHEHTLLHLQFVTRPEHIAKVKTIL